MALASDECDKCAVRSERPRSWTDWLRDLAACAEALNKPSELVEHSPLHKPPYREAVTAVAPEPK